MRWLLVFLLVGCAHTEPAADRDYDGIPDSADLCPDDPEDLDGYEDADGCPDPDCDDCCTPITQTKIGFLSGQSTIAERAKPVLNHVADELRTNNDLKRVEVRGAAARATAVRNYLAGRGVPPSKLSIAPADGAYVRFRLVESTCVPGG